MLSVNTGIRSAQQFDSSLFIDFVQWIDRGEKTTATYLKNLKQFLVYLRLQGIKQPTREDIIHYRQYLQEPHKALTIEGGELRERTDAAGNPIITTCKANTVNQYLRSVCQFFKWTAANNLYPDIAANIHGPKIRHDTHRKDALTCKEVLQIENSIKEQAQAQASKAATACKDQAGKMQRSTEQGKRLFAMYLLAVNAGLRTIELSRANIKDLQTKGGQTVLYIHGKGHSEADQKKPLAPEVHEAIKDYLNSRTDHPTGNSPLFVSTGNRSRGKRIASTTISTMLKRAMQAAGFDSERITAHSLRHTAGTAVQEITGDLFKTQMYMRHANPATTEIYLHNDTEKADAGIAQQLYNLYHDQTPDSLQTVITTMNAQQIEQLATLLKAMKQI